MKNGVLLLLLVVVAVEARAAVVDYTYRPGREIPLAPPTITGSPTCTGASGEGNAPDEYIIRGLDGFGELTSTATVYTKFFICPGDYTGAGTTTVSKSCSQATPCWLIYYSPTDPGTHPGTWTWDSPDRTHLNAIQLEGASWWRFVRIQWGKFNPAYTPGQPIPLSGGPGTTLIPTCSRPDFGSTDVVYHKIVCEGFTNHAMGSRTNGNNDRITIQHSVIRYMEIGLNHDSHCINIFNSTDFVVVSNEIYDCTDMVQLENHNALGTIIENNDMFLTPRMWVDCASSVTVPVQSDTGKCACHENAIDLKDVADSIADPQTTIVGNRIFGFRYPHSDGSDGCGGSGSSGHLITKSNESVDSWRIRIWDNFFWDIKVPAGASLNHAQAVRIVESGHRHSIVGNLIDLSSAPERRAMSLRHTDHEVYLNTVIGAAQGIQLINLGAGSFESMCNLFIDVDTPYAGSFPADATVGYDAYIASGAITEQVYTGTAYQNARLSAMNFDDLRIEYRLITGGTETKTFTDVVPTPASPAAILRLCPGTQDANTMGSRNTLGVDDFESDWP